METLKKILRIVVLPFAIIFLWIKVISCKKWAKKYKKDAKHYTISERYSKVRKMASLALYVKGVEVENIGLEKIPNKPMLFISNHKGNIDPIVLFKIICEQEVSYPIFVGKKELKNAKFGAALELVDTIFIDRGNLRQMYNSIGEQTNVIKSGKSICIFPEGTRTAKNEFNEFKGGSITTAYNSLCAIQPCIIYNSGGVGEKADSTGLEYPTRKDKKVYFKFLETIQSSKFININREIFIKTLQENMQKEYNDLKKEVEKGIKVKHSNKKQKNKNNI